jgi:hypothetical protein
MKAFIGKDRHEVSEHSATLQRSYVLHAHDVGLHCPNEAGEVAQQSPLRVAVVPYPLRVVGKSLTWRASNQDSRMPLRIMAREARSGEGADASSVELSSGIVVLIRILTRIVDIVPCDNIDASVEKPSCQPAGSAEEVNGCRSDRGALTHYFVQYMLSRFFLIKNLVKPLNPPFSR